jgi:8-oxo-dGTP diphosphatase
MDNPQMTSITKVTAAILIKNGQILIAQRKANDRLAKKWEFPGGKIKDNETPEQCLQRELKEEFEIDVSVGEYLGSNIYHYDHISIELLAYRTHWEDGTINLRDHDDYKWVSVNDLADYDFAPADIPFVEKLRRGEIDIRS